MSAWDIQLEIAGVRNDKLVCLLVAALQPAIMFVGEKFDSDQDFKQAKSLLLDTFRGQQV